MVDPIGTCQALDLLTQDQLEQLFDESNGYLSKVDEIFDTVQIADMNENNNNNNNSSSDSVNDANDANDANDNKNSANNKKKKKPKTHRRASSIITNKKCLILDVDNTLIYVRHFMDEMRVGDEVKLGERDAIVIKITYRLDLEFSENPGTMSSYDHVLQSNEDAIPQRGEWFPDELSKVAIIHQADPTGCAIKLITNITNNTNNEQHESNDDDDIETDDDTKTNENENENEIEISFLQNSDELSQLEPMMNRDNYITVTFMYGGYLVRIRPGLGQFLSLCNAKYDVILFTAADGSVYEGLLKQVHHILKQQLLDHENDNENDNNHNDFVIPHKLWQNVYFRSDCDEKLDEYGLPYRHKNLAKLGRELSTIVMVDDNPLSYRGFEPNSVRVAGFWGLSQPKDNELMQTLFPTLWTIADHKDVRYHLSGLGQPPPDISNIPTVIINSNDNNTDTIIIDNDDLLTRQRRHSRQASVKFLQHLKEAIVAENESLEESTDDERNEHNNDNVNENSESNDESSVAIEQTPDDSDDNSSDDNDSLDSISNPEEKQNIQSQNTQTSHINTSTAESKHQHTNIDVSVAVANDANDANNDTNNKLTNRELDDIFNDNKNSNSNNNNNDKNNNSHTRATSHGSESGIGSGGALIFDNYDEDILFRDAYDSPKADAIPATNDMFQKRPSIELDGQPIVNTNENDARRTVPNSPNDEDEQEEQEEENNDLSSPSKDIPPLDVYNDEEEEDDDDIMHKNHDYVLSPAIDSNISGSIESESVNKKVDTKLLKNSSNKNKIMSTNKSGITGFIDIEMGRKTGSRPSRTPTPISDMDAEILIEKTTSCSCFGWFGKSSKKNSKNIGLAQQELR